MRKAVILAGGLGSRLKPFTDAIPKPLLPIGEKSVLEIQIENLAKYGFKEIFIATNYKAHYIESFIGNGEKMGVKVTFSNEDKPLGTCGPLSLIKDKLDEPFLLMNGDILSTIDYRKMYDYGMNKEADFTVVTKEIRTPFNFGSVQVENDFITDVQEKPDLIIEIVAGMYFMRPEIFKFIPDDTYFGIDTLIKDMIKANAPIGRYLMKEYWLDIGRLDDYNEAQLAYKTHFKEE
ncbi:MAG: sugar phosphate nucleotidyltransferase [Candidatus Kapabacteria bacterium]|jgi:NDP-sugar pyrophosphorylase family protein|nr:sugar phosphate nucleotidyltransferase [Candidatus Kapabacteria bacterium]